MGNCKWNAHDDVADHRPLCRHTDKPIAALIQDLKLPGKLDSPMVVWATKFGRTRYCQNNVGDHNPHGATDGIGLQENEPDSEWRAAAHD